MVIAFLFMHFAPSIYWGATHSTIVAPLAWSLVGAAYSAIVTSLDISLAKPWPEVPERLGLWRPSGLAICSPDCITCCVIYGGP
jgi:hypothetical protein